MNKSDYTRKLEDLISNGSYSKVKKGSYYENGTERKLSDTNQEQGSLRT